MSIKGYKQTEEHKAKRGLAISLAQKGRKIPIEVREKMSNTHKQRGTGKWMLGRTLPESTREKMRLRKGELGANWQGGKTPANTKIRNSPEYKLWREAVFKRDGFMCVWCGEKGGILNADHIKPFSLFPELRLAIDNGRTLCIDCHKKTNTYLCGSLKHRKEIR